MEYFAKQKLINDIRNSLDGYIWLENKSQNLRDSGADGYGFDDVHSKELDSAEDAIQLQYNLLDKQLKKLGFTGHPLQVLEIYEESKLKAIQILEGCND